MKRKQDKDFEVVSVREGSVDDMKKLKQLLDIGYEIWEKEACSKFMVFILKKDL